MKKIFTLVALMALAGCSGQQSNTAGEPVNINSLGKSAITDVRVADEAPTYPSRGKSIERGFVHQPPLIPHKDDYPMTLDKNGCMTCHDTAKAQRMKVTAIHSSHLNADNSLNRQYFSCNQCHVAQADNKTQLIENSFSNK